MLSGKRYFLGRGELMEDLFGGFVPDYMIGDRNGNPVKDSVGAFQLQCTDMWPRQLGKKMGGPCVFRPVSPGGYQPGRVLFLALWLKALHT